MIHRVFEVVGRGNISFVPVILRWLHGVCLREESHVICFEVDSNCQVFEGCDQTLCWVILRLNPVFLR